MLLRSDHHGRCHHGHKERSRRTTHRLYRRIRGRTGPSIRLKLRKRAVLLKLVHVPRRRRQRVDQRRARDRIRLARGRVGSSCAAGMAKRIWVLMGRTMAERVGVPVGRTASERAVSGRRAPGPLRRRCGRRAYVDRQKMIAAWRGGHTCERWNRRGTADHRWCCRYG